MAAAAALLLTACAGEAPTADPPAAPEQTADPGPQEDASATSGATAEQDAAAGSVAPTSTPTATDPAGAGPGGTTPGSATSGPSGTPSATGQPPEVGPGPTGPGPTGPDAGSPTGDPPPGGPTTGPAEPGPPTSGPPTSGPPPGPAEPTGVPIGCFNPEHVEYASGAPGAARWGEPVEVQTARGDRFTVSVDRPAIREVEVRMPEEPPYVWEAEVHVGHVSGMGFTSITDFVLLDPSGTQCAISWADTTLWGIPVYQEGDTGTGTAAFLVPTTHIKDYTLVYVGNNPAAAQHLWRP